MYIVIGVYITCPTFSFKIKEKENKSNLDDYLLNLRGKPLIMHDPLFNEQILIKKKKNSFIL